MNNEIGFKDKRLLQALEYIDDEYIEDVFNVLKEPDMSQKEYTKPSPFKYWRQYLSAAACILVLSLLIPVFGYVAEVIGSFAAGTGNHTSSIIEDTTYQEETLNGIESTEEQTVKEPTPNFQYSNVKIIADNKTSINPISVHIGYTWYKDEKSVWTEEIASGWQYIINMDKYKYEYFPHLTLERVISSTLPENVTVSSFKVYRTNWEETEYSFDNPYELSNLPSGDYIIVGIESERLPYDKPHSVIGEYDYKLDESAIVFGLTVSEKIEQITTLSYLMFIPELEDVNDETMLKIKTAWSQFRYDIVYASNYPLYQSRGYSDAEAQSLAAKDAERDAENAYEQFFNSIYFYYFGYLGTFEEAVVIASYTGAGQPVNGFTVGGVDFGTRAKIYVYADENIISLQEAYDKKIITQDELIIIAARNEQYIESAYDYYIIDDEQALGQ